MSERWNKYKWLALIIAMCIAAILYCLHLTLRDEPSGVRIPGAIYEVRPSHLSGGSRSGGRAPPWASRQATSRAATRQNR
jgi:hypothetical protein